MPVSQAGRRFWRRKSFYLGSAILITFIVWFLIFRLSNASAIRRLKAEVRAKGQPLTLQELATTYAKIPDAENAAVPLLALWEAEDPEFWQAFQKGKRPLPKHHTESREDSLPSFVRKGYKSGATNRLSPEQQAEAARFLQEDRKSVV